MKLIAVPRWARTMRYPRSTHPAGAILILLAVACSGTSDPFIAGLIERTKPDGGRVTKYSGVKRTSVGVETTWVVETGMPWDNYATWVTGRLSPGFEAMGSGTTSLTFRKSLDADSYMIIFQDMADPDRPRVRVTVRGRPL